MVKSLFTADDAKKTLLTRAGLKMCLCLLTGQTQAL